MKESFYMILCPLYFITEGNFTNPSFNKFPVTVGTEGGLPGFFLKTQES